LSAFDQLDPLVQHHVVNTLGWRELRELQDQSIIPIQAGDHCLLLAPTAGGKTEAATFPILSRICGENWSGLSVLYVCPLKALLNNIHERLEGYCRMVGRRCDLWHGDIGPSQRNRIKSDPPDILLTTPESLEVMLISTKEDGRDMLRGVRTVIIDEIHAFAGDDRGWHLLSVLERIGRLAGREIQRVGLSATVGNPEELLTWLAGHCEGGRRVVQPSAPGATARTDVQLDYVGTLQNAALVISRLYRGEKRLVFCDSRSRVEELGNELRQLGISVFLSHSSLSAEERRTSEKAFSEAQDCVIVSTSTLELGIDVGDLDRVIQIDAPWTVASFLQRLGRTGRRSGALRNCLFLATSENALLRAGALLDLWESGFVEPVTPPARPLHLFAQQLMALSLQEGGIGIMDWQGWIGRLPAFANEEPEVLQRIIDFLLEHQILYSDGVRLSFGDAGQDLFGRRHFLELVSVFTSDPVFKVLHGRRELGTVDQITFLRHHGDEPVVLSMGGRSWSVTSLDWSRREAFVVPAETKGKSQWQGGKIGMSWRFARAVHALLTNDQVSERWTNRARSTFESLRSQYDILRPEADVVLSDRDLNEVRWFTFSGGMINTALADVIAAAGHENVSVSDFWIRVAGTTDARRIVDAVKSRETEEIRDCFKVSEDYLDNLKFNECLPGDIAQSILRDRLLKGQEIEATAAQDVIEIVC
jgi:ATP-dependent helicase Lhr and Lhr-like helicase